MSPLETLPPDISRHRILDTRSACAFVGVSVANWRRLRSLGQAPAPILRGSKKQGYRLGDLIAWIQSRVESGERA
jgi:predicted DNA-binding transcriptional regulator AlpA